MPDLPVFDAVIVAGGEGQRLGGIDKAQLMFKGATLLDRVIQAVDDADRVVVVGPPRPTHHPVQWTREEPEGGGPRAALEAGLAMIDASFVVVVAVDLPLLERAFIARLVRAADEATAAIAVDQERNAQPLLACYPTAPLRAVIARSHAAGRSMMSVLDHLAHRTIPDEGQGRDCDTVADVEDLQIEQGGGEHAGRLA